MSRCDRRRPLRRAASVGAVALTTVLLGGCLTNTTLTADGSDTYTFTDTPSAMQVDAPSTNTGGNLRMLWWDSTTAPVQDQESCATWSSETTTGEQQGAALRIDGDRAITVTKNIWLGGVWIFNAHVWTGADFTNIGSADLQSVFDPSGDPTQPLPLPWHLCARVIDDQLSFIAWPSTETKPAWDDPTHGVTWQLPAGWVYTGIPGWYVGHLPPGSAADYADLTAGSPDDPSPQSLQRVASTVH